jgi:hypothetical protein
MMVSYSVNPWARYTPDNVWQWNSADTQKDIEVGRCKLKSEKQSADAILDTSLTKSGIQIQLDP